MKTAQYLSIAGMLILGSALAGPTAAAGASTSSPPLAKQSAGAEDNAIRPFHVHVPQEALDELRRRIADTRWPDPETVADRSQGVRLAKLQDLVRYWGTDYDWRKVEAKLNSLPQFVTTIDGLDSPRRNVRRSTPSTRSTRSTGLTP